MRFRRLERLAIAVALLLPTGASAADQVRLVVQHSPLAGSQYHALDLVWAELQLGDPLELQRDADNPHDVNAIRVLWRGRMLGYVPRRDNGALAAAIDRGDRLNARISKLSAAPNPWQRLAFEVLAPL
jgi:hypothetical protein